MGNPNKRAVPPAKSNTNQENTKSKAVPPPALCPGHCGVRNRHEQNCTWTVTSPDLPTIVRVKQEALNKALVDQRFYQARSIRGWLELFYSWHGPYDESALKQLPNIPPQPKLKLCEDKYCPVQMSHQDRVFQPKDKDLPSTVVNNVKSLNVAKSNGDYERALASTTNALLPPSPISKMGNPNRRGLVAKPVKKEEENVTKATEQPAPLPAPVPSCSGNCGVISQHAGDATWTTVTNKNLPAIVKIKQTALKEALIARNFGAARNIHFWLDRFYSFHGPLEGSAMDQLPQIPEPPKTCNNAACPVKNHHHAKIYVAGSDDCPSIVKTNIENLNRAVSSGVYERTVAPQKFLNAFWSVHGDDLAGATVG
ncbi:MAG: hypothetical protein Q9169_007364 [Polycauliona sp. 2 TL-2023]